MQGLKFLQRFDSLQVLENLHLELSYARLVLIVGDLENEPPIVGEHQKGLT